MLGPSSLVAILGLSNLVASQSSVAVIPVVDRTRRSINAPLNCNNDYSYMGYRSFDLNTPFNVQRCADWCNGTSQWNLEHPPQDPNEPPKQCRFFNTYILSNNSIPKEQVCAMYTQWWDPEIYGVNDGYYDGRGNHLTISQSFFSSNTTPAANPICPDDIPLLSEDRIASNFCRSVVSSAPGATVTITTTARTETVQACRAIGTTVTSGLSGTSVITTTSTRPTTSASSTRLTTSTSSTLLTSSTSSTRVTSSTSSTRTTSSAPAARVRRDGGNDAGVKGVAAFYPEKYNAQATGDPVLIAIPAELLLSSGVYEAATSLAVNLLGSDTPEATDSATSTSTSTSTTLSTAVSTSTSTSPITSTKTQTTPTGAPPAVLTVARPLLGRQVISLASQAVAPIISALLPAQSTSAPVVVVTATSVLPPPVVVVTATSVLPPPVVLITTTVVPTVVAPVLSVVTSTSSVVAPVLSVLSSTSAVAPVLSVVSSVTSAVAPVLSVLPSTLSVAVPTVGVVPSLSVVPSVAVPSVVVSSVLPTTLLSASVASSTTSPLPVPTPAVFAGREARELASVCSRVVTGGATATVTEVAVATFTDYADCNLHPTTCNDQSSTPQLIAGSFTNSSENIDDTYYQVDLDFPICIYDECSTRVFPTTNGLISLGTQNVGINDYVNRPLPAENGLGVLSAFWDDLYIHAGERHYMDYSVCGNNGSRTVTFDWRMGRYNAPSDGPLYSFSATFYEDQPSRVFLKYFSTTDQGASATVGIEGKTNDIQQSYQYSYEQANITDGLALVFDPRKPYFGEASLEPGV